MTKNSPESGRGGWTQLSRYRQEPDKAPIMHPQPRDKQIVSAVHKYRYITTEGLLKLFAPQGRGDKALRRRLALLFHHQFLTRRYLHPLERPLGLGSSKAIYLLDTEGAKLLWGEAWRSGGEAKKFDRRKEFGYRHLKHSLSISEFQLALDLAFKEHPGSALESFVSDMEDSGMKVGVQIPRYIVKESGIERKGTTEKITVWPDASFSILASSRRYFYFLEVDQADRKKERIFKRFLSYWQYVVGERGMLFKRRGVSGAFVLFVAPNAKRRKALIDIANQVPEIRRNRPGFWFVNQEDVSLADPGRILREPIALGLDGNPGFLTKF
jgi:hypothetical protein